MNISIYLLLIFLMLTACDNSESKTNSDKYKAPLLGWGDIGDPTTSVPPIGAPSNLGLDPNLKTYRSSSGGYYQAISAIKFNMLSTQKLLGFAQNNSTWYFAFRTKETSVISWIDLYKTDATRSNLVSLCRILDDGLHFGGLSYWNNNVYIKKTTISPIKYREINLSSCSITKELSTDGFVDESSYRDMYNYNTFQIINGLIYTTVTNYGLNSIRAYDSIGMKLLAVRFDNSVGTFKITMTNPFGLNDYGLWTTSECPGYPYKQNCIYKFDGSGKIVSYADLPVVDYPSLLEGSTSDTLYWLGASGNKVSVLSSTAPEIKIIEFNMGAF